MRQRSRVELGEKSTPLVWVPTPSLSVKTCSYVFASHTVTPSQPVPTVIHLPSFDTARQQDDLFPFLPFVAVTRHAPIPTLLPPTRYSSSVENETTRAELPSSISMNEECRPIKRSAPNSSILLVRTGHCRRRIKRIIIGRVNEEAAVPMPPLPFIDIGQCKRSITSCFRCLLTLVPASPMAIFPSSNEHTRNRPSTAG